jgi:hypothetical protein
MSPFVWAAVAALLALQVLAVPAGATPIAAAGPACAYTPSASAEAAFSYVAPLASAPPFTGTFDASLLPVLG